MDCTFGVKLKDMSNQAFKHAVKLWWIIDLRFRFQNTDVRDFYVVVSINREIQIKHNVKIPVVE